MKFLQNIGFQKKEDLPEKPVVQDTQKAIAAPLLQTFGSQGVQSAVSSKTDYNKHLDDVLEANNQTGFDYLEFNKILNGLEGKPLFEPQKYETAFISAESMGVTPTTLINSGKEYLNVLSKEEQDFKSEMIQATQLKVTQKNQEVSELAAENAELSKKMEENNRKSQQLTTEAMASANELDGEQKAFDFALTNKKAIINDRLTKIQQYGSQSSK